MNDWIDILNSVPEAPLVGADGQSVERKPPTPHPRPYNQRALDRAWRVRGTPEGRDRPRAGFWRRKKR